MDYPIADMTSQPEIGEEELKQKKKDSQARYLMNSLYHCQDCTRPIINTQYQFDRHAPLYHKYRIDEENQYCCHTCALKECLPQECLDHLPLISAYASEAPSYSFLTTPPLPSQGMIRCRVIKTNQVFELYLENKGQNCLENIIKQHGTATAPSVDSTATEEDVSSALPAGLPSDAMPLNGEIKSLDENEDQGVEEKDEDITDDKSYLDYEKYFPVYPAETLESVSGQVVSIQSSAYNKQINNGLSRQYKEVAENQIMSQSDIFLMSAVRRNKFPIGHCHKIYASRDRTNDSLMGILECNLAGTQYTLYNHGRETPSPAHLRSTKSKWRRLAEALNLRDKKPRIRHELAHIQYQHFFKHSSSPIQINVHLPTSDFDLATEVTVGGSIRSQLENQATSVSTLLSELEPQLGDHPSDATLSVIDSYVNEKPVFHDGIQAYVLNFDAHRISERSVKNFLLKRQVNDKPESKTLFFQCGRTLDRNIFIMDFAYPLTPLTAFGLAMSAIDPKIGV